MKNRNSMDPYFVSYREMRDANRAGCVLQRLTDERSDQADPLVKKVENLQYRLRQQNMQQVQRWLQKTDNLLEIGAGLIDENGRSFFTKHFPEALLRKVYYCDSNPQLAQVSPELQCIDILELSKVFPKNAFSHIIGSNVLDTLDRSDLALALREIQKIAAPGAYLIHCLNYEPFLYAFYADIYATTPFAVPFKDAANHHCALLLAEARENPIFSIAASLEGEHRQQFWQGLLAIDSRDYLKKIVADNIAQGTVVRSYDHYLKKMEQACEEVGLAIEFNGEMVSEEAIDLPALNGQQIVCGPGGVETFASTSHDCLVRMKTHVLVATQTT